MYKYVAVSLENISLIRKKTRQKKRDKKTRQKKRDKKPITFLCSEVFLNQFIHLA